MGNYKIIWTSQAKQDLRSIFEYWKKKSNQGAINVRTDILNSPKTIYFSQQYQIDDVNPNYRRIVVRSNYKLLYREHGDKIYIVGIVCTSQNPLNLKSR